MLNAQDFTPAPQTKTLQKVSRPSLSYWQDAWLRLRKNKQAIGSLILTVLLILFTLIGPLIWSVNPNEQALNRMSEGPNLGSDVRVLPEDPETPPTILAGVPETTDVPASKLVAPTGFQVVGDPSTQGVYLRWQAVPGASGYVIYRTDQEPHAKNEVGIPVSGIAQGNQVSVEDIFDLDPGPAYYSIVAKSIDDESDLFMTIHVDIPPSITLQDARALRADAKPGDMAHLDARPMGTDALGRDLLARLMAGARVSLFIGFFAPLIYVLIGILTGGISGYFGGKTDEWMMRITDFVLALPFLLFMILFKIAFGVGPGENGIVPMLVALVVLSWVSSAKLVRGQILQLRESEFVQAARLLGAKPLYLILRHLIPNTLGVILVDITFAVPVAIFTEAFLSFIGMGVSPPTASWGAMCNDGIKTFLTSPHEFFAPAIIISVTVLAFNLLGDGLRDALDPKMRSRE